jgi:predicted DNA-binding antitoxin AbrB/MazE fold protein
MISIEQIRDALYREGEKMMQTVWAVIHDGRIEPSEPVELPEGARVLVTLLPEDERQFWLEASGKSLAAIWDNAEDDAYAP